MVGRGTMRSRGVTTARGAEDDEEDDDKEVVEYDGDGGGEACCKCDGRGSLAGTYANGEDICVNDSIGTRDVFG